MSTSDNIAVQEKQPKETGEQKKPKKKKWLIPAVIAVVVAAMAAGLGIYNAPQNRISRLLDLGNRYLTEADYEEAALTFEKAIAIDERNLDAYVGGLEAYLGKGVQEETEDFFQRILTLLDGLDSDYLMRNRNTVVELYLAADLVYGDIPERAAEVLEAGFVKTGENEEIKRSLIADYQKIAGKRTENGSYEDALTAYDRLLELDTENQEIIEGLCECLNAYIEILMEQGNYDRIRELAGKYRSVARKVNFGGILAVIDRMERQQRENTEYMRRLYDLMAAEDYDALHEWYDSEETEDFVARMEDDSCLFLPAGGDSGTGAGVYTGLFNGYNFYYFYYGDYAHGERKGNGTEFINLEDGYYLFTGAWDRDKPNGEGKLKITNGEYVNSETNFNEMNKQGQLVDGLWDGSVRATIVDGRGSFDVSFTADHGIPTEDKTDAYLREGGRDIRDGWYVYAYDILPYDGGARFRVLGGMPGKTVGVRGFSDLD